MYAEGVQTSIKALEAQAQTSPVQSSRVNTHRKFAAFDFGTAEARVMFQNTSDREFEQMLGIIGTYPPRSFFPLGLEQCFFCCLAFIHYIKASRRLHGGFA